MLAKKGPEILLTTPGVGLGPLMRLVDGELGRRKALGRRIFNVTAPSAPQYMPGGTPKWQFPM